jgi:hypothetical protein
MAIPPSWPAGMPLYPMREAFSGGPLDTRARFQTELGVPITRPRTSSDAETYDATFKNLKLAQIATFRAFVNTDLARGTRSFVWRDPVMGDVALWRILGNGERLFDVLARGADLHNLTLKLMRLPGTPWWAPYVRPGATVVPQVVADWNAGTYGIGGAKVVASALTAVAGTFNVYSVSSTDVETYTAGVVITPGDIPATAPVLTKRRVYFTP